MSENKVGIIEVYSCSGCPYYYEKYHHGDAKAHRCELLLNVKPYNPFDEVIFGNTVKFRRDVRCPLKLQSTDKILVICDECGGSGVLPGGEFCKKCKVAGSYLVDDKKGEIDVH